MGLTHRGLGRSALWGLAAGIGMAALAALFFAFPLIVAQPLRYAGYAGMDAAAFLVVVIPRLLVTHALLEEVLFRGFIQRQAILRLGTKKGIALTCGLFVLWHAVVSYHAVVGTNLPGALPVPLLYVATAIPLAGAGLVFSFLRHATGNLCGPIIAHWIVNGLILVALARG
jgi:membrane protease YdiL (CAAX protease family)